MAYEDATALQVAIHRLEDDLKYLDFMARGAKEFRDAVLPEIVDHGSCSEVELYGFTVHERVVPTFLVVKLSAFLDKLINVLWQQRFPEVNPKKVFVEEKLKILSTVHEIDFRSFEALRVLRNECAHNIDDEATWEQFEEYLKQLNAVVSDLWASSFRGKTGDDLA